MRYVDYPDSTGGSDRTAYTYNRQVETTTVTDQRGCVHSLVYDGLGRLTNDCVTTLGTGVDGAIRRLTAAYEVRGLTSKLTSYDNAAVGSGSIVNDVALMYNSFGQLISDSQSHSGAVGGGTPKVQYAYADGTSNMIRPTTLTYPNGRALTIGYGTGGGINDSTSRVDNLTDSSGALVNYAYLGLSTFVQTTYPEPSIQYTLLGSSSGNSPAGDIYWGLDQFGRIIDSRWFNTGTTADIDRIKYGYDRASNRIWRQNPVATAAGAHFDEFYTNDGLQRLKDMKRGTLNVTNTGITSPTFEQCWTLDPTGNWRGFNEAASGTAWTLNQTRTANAVNEITGITNSTGSSWFVPAYDAAGNMTSMPQPAAPESGFTATYDGWNRMAKLVDTGTGQTIQQNLYDTRNFRTVILTYASGVLSETRHSYFTSGWRCIEERVGTATTADKQFVWGGRYIDDLVLRDRGSERLYAMQDANWNVTSIATPTAAIQERYVYTAYGMPAYLTNSFGMRTSSNFTWEFLYCGYRLDFNSSLHQVRLRTYHPSLAFWCQRDSLPYADGASLYMAYSILNKTDPFALCANDCDGEWRQVHLRVRKFHSFTFNRRKFDDEHKSANKIWKQCCIEIVVDQYTSYSQEESQRIFGNDMELDAMTFDRGVPSTSDDFRRLVGLMEEEDREGPADAENPANGTPSLALNMVFGLLISGSDEKQASLQGESYLPRLAGMKSPFAPGASVGMSNIGIGPTIAHELGHLLLDVARHSELDNNLMLSGALGRELTQEQCETARRSGYAQKPR